MERDQEKNDIIELTEIVEEGPSLSGEGQAPGRTAPGRDKKNETGGGPPPSDPVSHSYDLSFRAMKKAMTSQVENWTAGEGE